MTLLRLKFVNKFRDRHGRWRHYFRRRGRKAVPLTGLPGSEEFMDAYRAALRETGAGTEVGARRTKLGTINALIVSYYQSPVFTQGLSPETQRMRRSILERFRIKHGDKRVATIQRIHVVKLIEKMTPHAQKNWLKTLRGLMLYAVAQNCRADDPSEGVQAVFAGKSLGHMTWGEGEIANTASTTSLEPPHALP